MSTNYDVRKHPQELDVAHEYPLTLFIGRYRKEMPQGAQGKKYLLEYRYARAELCTNWADREPELCYVENNYRFYNYLLSVTKAFEHHKMPIDKEICELFVFDNGDYFFEATRSGGNTLNIQVYDDDVKPKHLISLEWEGVYRLQNGLIRSMNWLAPEQSFFP